MCPQAFPRLLRALLVFTIGAGAVFPGPQDRPPDGKGARIRGPHAEAATASTPVPITYHGGPVMLGTTNVYFIFYGNWTANSATTLLPEFISKLSGTPHYNINTTYFDSANRFISNALNYAGSTTDNYSRGHSLSDADVETIVTSAINSGKLGPADSNGVYFVLASADVKETSGFCTAYCGWHTFMLFSGRNVKYAFIGNGDQCPSACLPQTVSPNGNAGADGMASIIAHELEETVTDPLLNAWHDSAGDENGDKCSWTFGATTKASDGSMSNMTIGSRRYFIQQNWVNDGDGYCALSWAGSGQPAAVTSVTPINASGSSSVFRAVYSDGAGAADLTAVHLLFNSAVNGAGACWIYYARAANIMYLVDDNGTGLAGSVTPGGSGTVANSQCRIASGGASSSAGGTLTLPVSVTFSPSFVGIKNVYGYASGSTGGASGWQTMGTWTPGVAQAAPTVASVAPINGSGSPTIFTATYNSGNVSAVYLMFGSTLSATGGCAVAYVRSLDSIYLFNDAGNALVAGSVTPGQGGSIANSQCTVTSAGAISAGASTLTFPVKIAFSAAFGGSRNVYAYVAAVDGSSSGWQTMGTWTTGALPPSAVSLSPVNGAGVSATFRATYSDPLGAADLTGTHLVFNSTLNGAGACWIYYSVFDDVMYLVNDAGSALVPGSLNPAGAGSLSNSQCTITGAGVTTLSGTSLSLPVSVSFAPGFNGTKNAYGLAAGSSGSSSGWSTLGTWTPR